MSQEETSKNIEKSKEFRSIRKRLGLTQEAMAEALGLFPSYISQLETGARPLDDFYLEKARSLEKSKSVEFLKEGLKHEPTEEACLDYFQQFLATCDDQTKLGWTLVELKEKFPMDKWTRSPGSSAPANSSSESEAIELLKLAADQSPQPSSRYPISRRSRGAGEPSAQAVKQSPSASQKSKARPALPKEVQGEHES